MTPQEQRNERLAQTIIKNLKIRHIEAFYCASAQEAVKKVSDLIEDGSSLTEHLILIDCGGTAEQLELCRTFCTSHHAAELILPGEIEETLKNYQHSHG